MDPKKLRSGRSSLPRSSHSGEWLWQCPCGHVLYLWDSGIALAAAPSAAAVPFAAVVVLPWSMVHILSGHASLL
ncbi:MAG: hypothetical protein HY434_00885 [Candidatus Liptonbacteria bacterium]|nr:hypothetical protein [Candidatus Liptonbacteria bacterium]